MILRKGKHIPGPKFCRYIASALDLQEELVFIQAGHLSPKIYTESDFEDWIKSFSQLSISDQQELLEFARFKLFFKVPVNSNRDSSYFIHVPINMINFSEWPRSQLDILGWNPTYLADRSTIDQSYICQILSGRIIPGVECCRAFAHALLVSEETVLRQAGHLSPKPYEQSNNEDWVYLLSELPEDDRQELLDIAEVKLHRQN